MYYGLDMWALRSSAGFKDAAEAPGGQGSDGQAETVVLGGWVAPTEKWPRVNQGGGRQPVLSSGTRRGGSAAGR